ncbi:hypothetical protein [Cellulomonas sp. Root137]|uniref:hypothetical protein n=1 Tax=Cellulomonas sp. Root137 TaxID=1736459 RepID=UPI0006F942F1|nr:hypothetical protein [Cellulomonas sp. Root137]KQY43974.1 hypothetical protein ASD18_16655 [Cellulomonas sp. Root137]
MAPHRVDVDPRLLRIYLSDHVAGATGAIARSRRMARAYDSTPLGGPIGSFAEELEGERVLLLELSESLGLRLSRWKSVGAAAGERVGRLKPNGRLTSASPLSALLELELLRGGVNAKRGLWDSLASWSGALGLERARFEELDRRGLAQIELLEQLAAVARDRVAAGMHDVSEA